MRVDQIIDDAISALEIARAEVNRARGNAESAFSEAGRLARENTELRESLRAATVRLAEAQFRFNACPYRHGNPYRNGCQ